MKSSEVFLCGCSLYFLFVLIAYNAYTIYLQPADFYFMTKMFLCSAQEFVYSNARRGVYGDMMARYALLTDAIIENDNSFCHRETLEREMGRILYNNHREGLK